MAELGDRPVFLIGYRGTGKSTVARELAELLQYAWVDSDEVVERRAGKSIAAIFADDGEPAFRNLEARVVAELAREQRVVAALGGGAIVREEIRSFIKSTGTVVWLTATVGTILQRIGADTTSASRRPKLTAAAGDRAEIELLLAARTALYRECATLVVDTEGKTAAEVADEIATQLTKP